MLRIFFKYILLIILLQLSHFFLSFISVHPPHPSYQNLPAFSSCPWVVHITSLASPFPILFLTSPCPFCTYQLCFLFPVPFSPLSPLPLPTDKHPCDLHFCDSVPVPVVGIVSFHFCFLGLVVDSCEFVVILLFIVFDVLFLR